MMVCFICHHERRFAIVCHRLPLFAIHGEYSPLFTPNPLRSVFGDDISGDERTDVRSLSAIFPLNMVRYRLLRGKKGKAAVVLAAYPCVA